jgi:hypothetical protein
MGSSYLKLLLEFVPSKKSAKLHEEEATMSENEQNQNLLGLTMTKFSTVLQEIGETLPSTRSDSGTSPAITHLPSHRDAEISDNESSAPTPSFRLEIKGDKGQTLLTTPVSLKNLYSGIVVLEVNSLGFIRDPETLQGKQAILRVMTAENPEWMSINGIMTWTYNTTDQTININLRMQVAQPNKLASKILENSLPAASGEMKRLWTLWDETQANRESILTRLRAKLLSWRRLS